MIPRLLTALAIPAIAIAASAQTADSPSPITPGENSWDGNIYTSVYFSYTAEADELVTLDGVQIQDVKCDGTAIPVYSAYDPEITIFQTRKGSTYLLNIFTVTTSINFTAEMTPHEYNDALTCSDPVTATEGEFTFVPCATEGGGFMPKRIPVYASFTPSKSGRLEIFTKVYPYLLEAGTDCDNFTPLTKEYTGDGYCYTMTAEAGVTNIFRIQNTQAVWMQFSVVDENPGSSCEDAWTAVPGDGNEIPAAAGTYWYRFTAPASPALSYAEVSSEAGGSIEMYLSCGSETGMQSCDDAISLRVPVQASDSRVFKIVKNAATAAPQSLSLAFTAPQPYDSFETALPVEAGQATVTPAFGGTYYYSVTSPAEGTRFLDVKGAGEMPEGGIIEIYSADKNFLILASGRGEARCAVVPDNTYVVKVVCPNSLRSYRFTMDFSEVREGEIPSLPITAAIGSNEVPPYGNVYFTYTPTADGWIELNGIPSVPLVTTGEDGKENVHLYPGASEDSRRFKGTAGTSCLITFHGVTEATTFTLAESSFMPGDTPSSAIPFTDGSANVETVSGEVWYVYECESDGFLQLSSTVPYTASTSISVYLNSIDTDSRRAMTGEGEVFTPLRMAVERGDKAYVCVSESAVTAGGVLTAEITAARPGEAPYAAIEIPVTGDPTIYTLLTGVTDGTPAWYSVQLNAGTLSLSAGASALALSLYAAGDTQQPLATASLDFSSWVYGFTDVQIPAKGEYLLEVGELTSEREIVLTGNSLVPGVGVEEIAGENSEIVATEYYTTDGRRISAPLRHGVTLTVYRHADGTHTARLTR